MMNFDCHFSRSLIATLVLAGFIASGCSHPAKPIAPVGEIGVVSVAKPELAMNVKDRYRLFIPRTAKNLKPAARALLVMLHGCSQVPEDLALISDMNREAERGGFVVLYPAQLKGRHPQNCWRWFDEANQKPGGGELGEVLAMIKEAQKTTPIDPQKIFVAGLSAGAGLASELLACHPNLFRGGALHSGPAFGIAQDETTAQRLLTDVGSVATPSTTRDCDPHKFNGRLLIVQGGNDLIVHPGHSKDLLDQFTPDPKKMQERVLGLNIQNKGVIPTRVICRGGPKPQECLVAVSRLGHAWSGGKAGPFSDPRGPSSSELIRRFVIGGEVPFTTKIEP